MTDRLDFLYLTVSYQEEFKVCWSQYTDYEKERRQVAPKPTWRNDKQWRHQIQTWRNETQ